MGDVEAFAVDAVEEIAFDRLARGECDAVHEDVETVAPVRAEFGEAGVDLFVGGDVERQHDLAAVLGGGVLDARLQLLVLVGQRQFRAFAVHGIGDAGGDRTLAGDAGDQCALALQETHGVLR